MTGRLTICVGLLAMGLAAQAEAATKTKKDTSAKKPPSHDVGRLEDIHIEGEIPVPQVLFVTGRDQRRFMDFQHRRYLKTSQQVGEATVFPSRITVVGNRSNDARKETEK